jgi:hypothetical protein
MKDGGKFVPAGAENFSASKAAKTGERHPLAGTSDAEIDAVLGKAWKPAEQTKEKEINPLDAFSDKEKIAIVKEARQAVDAELNEREAEEQKNTSMLPKMRASVEKGTSAADQKKQLDKVRLIMLQNKIAEICARRSKGSAAEIAISEDDLDSAFDNLGKAA